MGGWQCRRASHEISGEAMTDSAASSLDQRGFIQPHRWRPERGKVPRPVTSRCNRRVPGDVGLHLPPNTWTRQKHRRVSVTTIGARSRLHARRSTWARRRWPIKHLSATGHYRGHAVLIAAGARATRCRGALRPFHPASPASDVHMSAVARCLTDVPKTWSWPDRGDDLADGPVTADEDEGPHGIA